MESYNERDFAAAGICDRFVQDNHSSSRLNVVRGIHFQGPPSPAAKLVRCSAGSVWDVAVDLRAGSPTLGQWYGLDLTAEQGNQLFIPVGFGHGFVALTDMAEVQYKSSALYDPIAEGTITWNDPHLAIDWPVASPILSDKDQHGSAFSDYASRPVF